MATPLMRAKDVAEEYGWSRTALLRWEEAGLLRDAVIRTPGGQRRYRREVLQSIRDNPFATEKQPSGKVSPPPVPMYTEFGVSGLRRWGGAVYEERLKALQGRAGRILLREMRLNDPVVGAIFLAIENAMRRAPKRVKPSSENAADQAAAEFIGSCFDDMSWSWGDQFSFILEALEQGFSLLEVVWKRRLGENPPPYCNDPAPSKFEDGRIGWRKWAPRPALSLAPGAEWIFDPAGGIKGALQQPETDGITRPLPIEKLLHFRTTAYPANNPEGLPIHRAMYVPWYYSNQLMEVEGIGIERDLAGIPVVYLGRGTTLSGVNSDFELSQNLVVNLRQDEQAGVVFPHPKLGMSADGQGVLLELLSSGGSRRHDVDKVINRYDKRKALAVLAQFILLGMERVGSFALSKHQGDLFVLSVEALLKAFAEVINRHGIPRLMRYNYFPGITGNPELVYGTVGIPDLKEVSEFVNRLVQSTVLTPDPDLERHLRQLADLPQPPIAVTPSLEDRAKDRQRDETEEESQEGEEPGAEEEGKDQEGKIRPGEEEEATEQRKSDLLVLVKMDGRGDVDWVGTAEAWREKLGGLDAGLLSVLRKAIDEGWTVETMKQNIPASHIPEEVSFICPLCGHDKAFSYPGHGGLLVCQNCGKTYHPQFEQWTGAPVRSPVAKARANQDLEDEEKRGRQLKAATREFGDFWLNDRGAGRVRAISEDEWAEAELQDSEELGARP